MNSLRKAIEKKINDKTNKIILFLTIIALIGCGEKKTSDEKPLTGKPSDTMTYFKDVENKEHVIQINHKLAQVESEINQLEMAIERVNLQTRENLTKRIEDLEKIKEYLNAKLEDTDKSAADGRK